MVAPSLITPPPTVDYSIKQYVDESLPALLEKSGNLVWSGKWPPCVSKMYTIHMRKLENISVRQTYHWKARFFGFLGMYSFPRSLLGFLRN